MESDYNPKSLDNESQKPYRNIVKEVSGTRAPTMLDDNFDEN
jgi:hypothetical protein